MEDSVTSNSQPVTEYVVPDSALGDLSYEKTQAEYEDMCRTRMPRVDEPESIKVLRAHEEQVQAARAVVRDAEIEAMNASRKYQPTTGEHDGHLFEPFTVRDLSIVVLTVDRRDEVRVPALLDDLAQRCSEEHRNHMHPFCPGCRRYEEWAEASLRRWLALNPGRNLPEVDDSWTPEAEVPTTRKTYLSYDDLAEFPDPEWLIPNVVPDQSVGYLAGRDGTYKTFLAIAITMLLVSQGRPVLFIAGEGVRSFRKRIDAWLDHNGVEMTEDMKRCLDIRAQTVDLFEAGADYAEMVKRAEERQYALIVVDTLARSSGAAEQNSNSDMNVITQRVDRLKHAAGATVLVVAHTDKGDNWIRGASTIRDNGDFQMLMQRKGDEVELSVKKMKDNADDYAKRFAVLPVGESIVLIPAEQKPEPAAPVEGSHTTRNRILVALAGAYDLGYVPATTIRQIMAEDAVGDVNPGSIWRDLNNLVKEGIVLKNTSTKAYRLNADDATAQRYMEAS